jgi:NAD(P)-dependent dehydrogenase (short-subunit alcohol dehydrogenase family)
LQKDVLQAGEQAEQTTNKALLAFFTHGLDEVRQHGVTVTILQPGAPKYKAFETALQPLADAQRAHVPADLVKLVADVQH